MLQRATYGYAQLFCGIAHSNPVDVTSEVHSRFGVGLRGVYLERHGGWLVVILALPSMLITKKFSPSLTELLDRARATLLPTTKPQKSCRDWSTDP